MATKKELKEIYKQMRPDMGVFFLVDDTQKKGQIFAVTDLKSRINRVRFQLEMGSSPLREIQKEWTSLGADRWDFRILDYLDYDEDERKTDYQDDLELLKMEWEEKLARQGYTIFLNSNPDVREEKLSSRCNVMKYKFLDNFSSKPD